MTAWNKINIPRDTLENLYVKQKLSIAQIAQKLECSTQPIHRTLKEYKIPIRNLTEACTKIFVSEKQLKQWYLEEKLSMQQIADKLGCTHSAIVHKFKRFDIVSRGCLGIRKPLKIKKEGLTYHYNRGLSLDKIAKIYHCSEGGIQKRFEQYNIVSRGNKNRASKYKKKDFSGDPIEKAYLIGFRLGDLNVKKCVSVIQIRCSTTHWAQVQLIRNLFKNYTTPHVWKAKRGTYEIVCLVNRSFSFLIPKYDDTPRWILGNKNTFFAFFAGYIDAEGYFYLIKPKKFIGKINAGCFGIQTQQKQIILDLSKNLVRYDVYSTSPSISRLAGAIDSRGIKNNKDMWSFTVNSKLSLWRMIHYLKPYIKHAEKVTKMKIIEKNILARNSLPYCRPIRLALP